MNLEELQIKIGIELKELNKQLKKASDDINKHIGPKATKKLMADNNKVIKRGLDDISRTTMYSVKKMRKDTTKEIDDMSKDINKSLTKAFDINLTKFNKNIDASMAQAKRSVRSACNDIRRELNAALNVKANIRVSASTSAQRQSSSSKSDAYAIMASSQYTAAMMVKAINAMIDTNNKNTTRLEGTINKSTDRIIAALNKTNKTTHTTTAQKPIRIKNPKKAETTTRGVLVGKPYGPDYGHLIEALKNAYKTINILNRNLSALNSLKNIKQLGTGSNAYGRNGMQGGTVNWRQGRKGSTVTSFEGELVNPVIIPVEPFKQIQDIIEVINYEIKDFETGLVKVGSRAVSVVKTLNSLSLSKAGNQSLDSKTKSQPLKGEIVNPVITTIPKEPFKQIQDIITDINYTVKDFEEGLVKVNKRAESVSDVVKKIKIPQLAETNPLVPVPGKEGVLDTSQIDALKQVQKLKHKINNTPLMIKSPAFITEEGIKKVFKYFNSTFVDMSGKMASAINDMMSNSMSEATSSSLEDLIKPLEEYIKKMKFLSDSLRADFVVVDESIDVSETRKQLRELVKEYENLIDICKKEDFLRKTLAKTHDTKDTSNNNKNFSGSDIKDMLALLSEEFDDTLSELAHSLDPRYFEETLSSLKDWIKPLEESLKKIKAISKALDIGVVDIDTTDATDAKNQIEALTASYEALIDACKTGNASKVMELFPRDVATSSNSDGRQFPAPPPNKKVSGSSNKGGKPPKPTIMGFGFGGFKNEIDTIIEYAKKAGEKIKKALFGKSKDGSNELAITIDDDSFRKLTKIKKDTNNSGITTRSYGHKGYDSSFEPSSQDTIYGSSSKKVVGIKKNVNNMDEAFKALDKCIKTFDAIIKDFDKSVKEFKSCVDRLAERDARKELEFEIDNSLKELDDFRDKVRGITSEADFDNTLEELDSLRNKVEELTGEEIKFDFEISDEEFESRIDSSLKELEDLRKRLGVVEIEPTISDEEFENRIDSMLKELEDLRKKLGEVEVEPIISDEEFENRIDSSLKELEDLRKKLEALDSKKGKNGPSKPYTLGFGLGGFKNEIDTIIEYAKKAGSKIRKALADAFKHKESSKSNPFGNGMNIERSTVNGETKVTVNGKDLKDLTSEELDAYNKVMSESNKAYTDAMKNLNTAMNGMAGSFSNNLESNLNNLGDSISESVKKSMDVMNDPNLLKILKDKGIKPGESFDETFIDQYGNKTRVKSTYTDNSINNNNLNNGYDGKDIEDLASEKLKDLNSAMAEMEKEFGNFNDAIDDFNKSIEEMTKSVSDSIKEVPKTDNAPNKVNPTINEVQEDTGERNNKPLGSSLFNKAKKELDKLSNAVKNTVSKLNSSISKFASNTKAKLSNAFASIKPIKLYSSITSGLNKAKSAVSKFASNTRAKLNNVFTNFKFGKLYASITSGLNKAKSAITKFASNTRAKLSNAFAGVTFGKLYASVSSALNKAKSAVSKFAGKVRPILSKAFKNINLSNIGGSISKGLNKAKGALSKFANGCKTIWGKIKQIFSKGANDASKATGKLTTGLKSLLSQALGFFSLYGLINLGKQAITESQTLAQAEVKLTSLMKQRMGATKETVKAIRELAKEQANLGVVSETAMVRGAEQLSMYVHSAKALQTLMPAIANMTARRGGFNATPEDAEEIATQLGEAIREGTTTPLEQSGIYLSEAEIKKFQALRTEEERAAYLADVIAKNVGNINEALANTPHGQIAQLKNNFKSLLGTLGTLLVNVIQPIVKWLNVLVVAANNALKALGELLGFDMTGGGLSGVDLGTGSTGTGTGTEGIDNATDSLEEAEDAAGAAEEAVEKFKGSLMGFDEINILSDNTNKDSKADSEELDPTDITPGDAGQLIPTEMTEGDSIFSKFAEKMKAFMDEILEPFKNAWDLLGERWKEEWADLIESFKHFCDSLASFLKSVWDHGGKEFVQHMAEIALACGIAAMEIGGEILDSLARLWEHLDPAHNKHTQGFLDALNETSVKLRDFILGLGDHFESLMANGGQDVLNAMGDCFMDLGNAAVTGLGIAIDALDGLIDHLDPANNENTKKMLQVWADAFHAIGQCALDFVDLLDSVLKNGGQEVINALGDAFVSLVGLVGTVVKEVSEAFSGLFKHLDPETNQFTKDFLKAWENAFNSISDMFNSFGDLLGSVMDNGGQELLNSVGDLGMKLGEAFGVIVDEVSKTLGELFEHLDPSTNPHTKKMLESLDGLVDSITGFVDACIKAFQNFMDNGGREVFKHLGDILAIVIDLAAVIGGGLIDIITGFMNSWVGQALIEGVARALEWVAEKLTGLADAFEIAKDIVQNIVDIIVGIFEGDSEKVGKAFANLIKNAFKLTGELVLFLGEVAGELIAGLVKGICALPGLLWEAVKFIFDTIVNFFKELFGIHSPSTVFAELGENLIEGLVKGVEGAISLVTGAFKKIGETILGAAKEIVKNVSEKFKETKEAINEKLKETKEVVSEKWKEIKQTVSDRAKESYEIAKENWNNLKETVSEKTKETYNSIKENWKNVKDTAVEIFKGTYEVVKDNWTKIKDTVSDKAKDTYETAKDKWANLKQVTSDRFKETYDTIKDKFTNIRETVKTKATQTFDDISATWSKMKDDCGNKLEQIRTDAEQRYNDVKTTIVGKINETKEGVIAKWEEVRTKTNESIENVRKTSEDKYNEIKDTIVKRLEEIKSSTESKWEEIKKNTGSSVEKIRQEAETQYGKIKDSLVKTLENTKSAMATVWGNIKTDAISKATEIANQVTTKFGEIKTKFTSKMDEVKSALGPKWDSLKSQASTSASNIVSSFQTGISKLGSNLGSVFSNLKSTISSKLSSIGSLFNNLNWTIKPQVKLPKVSVTWKDVGGEGGVKIPSFSVNWNKRGGIIDGVTPLGFANGALQMGGEAGKEMVVPLENTSFTTKIAKAIGQAVDNTLARSYNNMPNNNNNSENRDVVLQLDGREFARASINSINKLQRESGRTLLDI